MQLHIFPNVFARQSAASSSQFDDATIPARSKRMTVAQLRVRMDARFNAVDRRFSAVDRRFDALDRKLDEHLASIKLLLTHHDQVVDEHDKRLNDLEAWRKTRNHIGR